MLNYAMAELISWDDLKEDDWFYSNLLAQFHCRPPVKFSLSKPNFTGGRRFWRDFQKSAALNLELR